MDEVRQLIKDFEDCTIPRCEWNHRAHLAVALWYMSILPEPQATERVITGIRRYNRANGILRTAKGGYHETMTLFWLAITRRFLSCAGSEGSFADRLNDLVRTYSGRKDLFLEYYSRERIFSWEARLNWVEPDVKPLPLAADCPARPAA